MAEYGGLVLGTQHPLALSPWQQHRKDNVNPQQVEKHEAAQEALLPQALLLLLSGCFGAGVRVKETLRESLAAMGCGDGALLPRSSQGFGGISGRGWQRREAARDYPQLLHDAAAALTQSLKTALTQPSGSSESQASGRIPEQGLEKGFLPREGIPARQLPPTARAQPGRSCRMHSRLLKIKLI